MQMKEEAEFQKRKHAKPSSWRRLRKHCVWVQSQIMAFCLGCILKCECLKGVSVCVIRRQSWDWLCIFMHFWVAQFAGYIFKLQKGKTPMDKKQKCREQTSKHKQECHQTDKEHVHHPDRLAAALAVMPANNSRITLQSLLNRCKHWHRQRERVRLSIVLNSLNELVCPHPYSNAPLCPGRHFLSLSFTTAASLLFSPVRPYLSLTVLILPFCYILHPSYLGLRPIAGTVPFSLFAYCSDCQSLLARLVACL